MKPNDGECHLNERGEYTHSVLQDYPSVSQVSVLVYLPLCISVSISTFVPVFYLHPRHCCVHTSPFSSSVIQINQVTKQHKINLIFAVTREQSSVYSRLAQMIEGSSQGELTEDSSNVVQLVKEEYGVRDVHRMLVWWLGW